MCSYNRLRLVGGFGALGIVGVSLVAGVELIFVFWPR